MHSTEQLQQAVDSIRQQTSGTAGVGLILGTGLGGLARHIQAEAVIPYSQIPHFPTTSALSHKGQLVCGRLAGTSVVAMEGRNHVYEGHPLETITFGVRIIRSLGADCLIVSNAAGGLNPRYQAGDVMILEDHVNLMFRQPPPAPPHDGSRPIGRLDSPYDPALIEQALAIARMKNIAVQRGVYVAVTGPNYETRAEYRFLRMIGGDAVGMSTVPEAILAAQLGMRVLALSTITNIATPDVPHKVEAQQVVKMAQHIEPHLRAIVEGIINLVGHQNHAHAKP